MSKVRLINKRYFCRCRARFKLGLVGFLFLFSCHETDSFSPCCRRSFVRRSRAFSYRGVLACLKDSAHRTARCRRHRSPAAVFIRRTLAFDHGERSRRTPARFGVRFRLPNLSPRTNVDCSRFDAGTFCHRTLAFSESHFLPRPRQPRCRPVRFLLCGAARAFLSVCRRIHRSLRIKRPHSLRFHHPRCSGVDRTDADPVGIRGSRISLLDQTAAANRFRHPDRTSV